MFDASKGWSIKPSFINQAMHQSGVKQSIKESGNTSRFFSNNNTKSKPAIHQSIHQSIHTWIVWELVFNYTPSPHPQKKWNRKKTRGLDGLLIVFNPRWVSGSVFPNFFLVQVDAFAISKIIPHTSKHLLIRDWLGIPRIAEQQSDHQQLTVDSCAFGSKQDSQHSPERLKRVQSPQKTKQTTDIYVGSSKATGKSIKPSTTTDLKRTSLLLKTNFHLMI